ncbi:alpha/beta fold hydrolase [Massilia sp. MB5]|uniref:alpha/beta hydrolase family protein n=1 Tax=Massilia sp. MB5 TaxID=2919578 RepID=UPI001F0D646E|nr:alpha/beta fold hydrolase [Massilia sp. MB5]UMR30718.1 alpha/beta fold hydrolase [Massilia sp. MB5]
MSQSEGAAAPASEAAPAAVASEVPLPLPSDEAAAPPAGEALTLRAADGYALAAVRYRAAGTERGRLIVAGATGVPQGFYRRFAEFAAARGYTVLTFDYRGVGRSAPASLRGFDGDFLVWGRQDLAAAVAHMADGEAPLYLVGHSYGGHALGLLPEPQKIDGMYVFGTGAGWHGWMPRLERIRVLLMWNVAGPLLVRWKGFLAWSKLGMGEDLPLGVYRQWKHWCRFPHYFFDDPKMRATADGFSRVRAPIVAVNATDDAWAPPRSRDAFMRGYRNAAWSGIDVHGQHSGLGPIGHMGYFRAPAQPLWEAALHWFDGLRLAPQGD